MKKTMILALVLALVGMPSFALASDFTSDAQTLLDEMDFSAWDRWLEEIPSPVTSARALIESILNQDYAQDASFFQVILSVLFSQFSAIIPFCALIFSLCLACALLNRLSGAFGKKGGVELICFILVAAPCIQSFSKSIAVCVHAIDSLCEFTTDAVPAMLALNASIGAAATSALLEPSLLTASYLAGSLIRTALPYALSAASILLLAQCADTPANASGLLTLILSVSKALLTAVLFIFAAVTSIKCAGAASLDRVSVRAAKYTVDNFVPVVGGFFADSFEVLAGSVLTVKTAMGAGGLIFVALLLLSPMCVLIACWLAFKLLALAAQLLDSGRVCTLLDGFAKIYELAIAALCSCAMLFVVVLAALLLCTGGLL